MKNFLFAFLCCFALSSVAAQDCQLRTQTMGGWGAAPSGNNPGQYLHQNFAGAFPQGLIVGCAGGFTCRFTSAQAITDFLPASGKSDALTSNHVNAVNLRNTFAGQVTALAISVGFDNYDPNFAASHLASAQIKKGAFAGMSVAQILAEANKTLGGCNSQFSINQLNEIVTAINESFVDGQVSKSKNSLLNCPPCPAITLDFASKNVSCNSACDGSASVAIIGGQAPVSVSWSTGESTADIMNLCAGNYDITVSYGSGCEAFGSVNISEPQELQVTASGSNAIICEDDSSICKFFDIESLSHDTKINTYFENIGVTIDILPGIGSWADAIVYDSDGNWTEDPDLNLGVGKVVIIQENRNNNDGDGTGADDGTTGGTQIYHFAKAVTVESFLFLDCEDDGGIARAYDANNNLITSAPILNLGNATVQTVIMNASGVRRLEVQYPKSGAVKVNLSCPADTICSGSAMAVANGGVAPYSFAWNNGETTETIEDLCPGTYDLTVTDDNGCSAIASVIIGADPCAQKKDAQSVLTETRSSFMMAAYPNPFEQKATLQFMVEKTTEVRAEIISIQGRKVMTLFSGTAVEGEQYTFTLDGSQLAGGMYFYHVTTAEGDGYINKLFKGK